MSEPIEIKEIAARVATIHDRHLLLHDHTSLSAVNTCPTWGIIRYYRHKRMPGAGRELPLEAGTAMHDAFSAIRLFCLWLTHPEHALHHSKRIFGGRSDLLWDAIGANKTDRTNMIAAGHLALRTSGYFDDPNDKNRTISNMEDCIIAYADRTDPERYPIWIRNEADPTSDVGIENKFDIIVDVTYTKGTITKTSKEIVETLRYAGRLDGLHHMQPDRESKLFIWEEKTAFSVNDAWLSQWVMSHQITGYCVASAVFTGFDCRNAKIRGTKIPLSRDVNLSIRDENVPRSHSMTTHWAYWLLHTTMMIDEYSLKSDGIIPRYTHSCTRFFRPCSFIPLCTSNTSEEWQEVFESMETNEWSPLDD